MKGGFRPSTGMSFNQLRIGVLAVMAVVLLIAFIATGGRDKVEDYIDQTYVKESSQQTDSGSFSVYYADRPFREVYEDIISAHEPENVEMRSSKHYVLTYPHSTVGVAERSPTESLITVDSKYNPEQRRDMFKMLLYVLLELGDAVGDEVDSNYDYDYDHDYDTRSDTRSKSKSYEDWSVDEPTTGGSGSFTKRGDQYDLPSSGWDDDNSNDDFDLDFDWFSGGNEVPEPELFEGSGSFNKR